MKHTEENLENDIALQPLHVLKAGPTTATYEAGRLRYIGFNNCEVVRIIFPALRDEHWVTIPMQLSNETIKQNERSFNVRFHGSFHSPAVQFEADFAIDGGEDGTIIFEMNGKALNSFKSKRTGLCVHHPIHACMGRPVEIIHPGGNAEKKSFPVLINPRNPFTDITGMRYITSNNIAVEINFEGDEFETEDQRNWSDDSFKTYSGPQYKTPMVEFREGDAMHHRITVKPGSAGSIERHEKKQHFEGAFPNIGYGYSLEEKDFGESIKSIPCSHLLVDIDLRNKSWKESLSKTNNVPLRLVVRFTDFSIDEVDQLSSFVDASDITVKSVMVVSKEGTPPPMDGYHTVYHQLKKTSPKVAVGFGSTSWFAGVNLNISEAVLCDFTGFVVMPQVHLTDERSIMENLLSQHTILETLRKQTGGKPADIHFLFSRTDDPRLHTQFGAWWVLNAIANTAEAGIITLSDVVGKNGILNEASIDSPLVRLLQRIKSFQPVRISCERDMSERDPMASVRSSRVTLENATGETITFTMKDI